MKRRAGRLGLICLPVFAAAAFVVLTGCASEVIRTSASLSPPAAGSAARIEIAEDASVQLSTGYSRLLPRGSVWELRGTVPEGNAYRRVNGVFTVEGTHVHEAYIVISRNRLVGFYLPVESAYASTAPVELKLK